MKNFGYTINRDRQIDYDSLPKDIYQELKKMEPSVNACISCGTCAATCSAGQFTDFSLRKYILLLRRGNHLEVAQDIDKCMHCGKCLLVCPMGVNTRNVIHCIQKIINKYTLSPTLLVADRDGGNNVKRIEYAQI